MYSLAELPEWQPLSFNDFSQSLPKKLAEKQTHKAIKLTEPTLQEKAPTTREMDNTFVEQELARLKAEVTEKAYQEGLALGKEEGFLAGKNEGYEQGYQLGQQEGHAQIHQQLEQQIDEEKMMAVQAITDLVANFQQAINEIDEKIVPKLADLALIAAQKMVGDLPKTKHKQLAKTIEDLINQFPPLGECTQLHVNPDDISSIETLLSDELAKYGWKLVANPSIECGGCKVLTDKNEIDATQSSKWQVITDLVNEGDA